MKRNLIPGRINSGQALMIFLLMLCLVTALVLASINLNKSCYSTSSAKVGEQKASGSSLTKINFPYNRYYNEVLIY